MEKERERAERRERSTERRKEGESTEKKRERRQQRERREEREGERGTERRREGERREVESMGRHYPVRGKEHLDSIFPRMTSRVSLSLFLLVLPPPPTLQTHEHRIPGGPQTAPRRGKN